MAPTFSIRSELTVCMSTNPASPGPPRQPVSTGGVSPHRYQCRKMTDGRLTRTLTRVTSRASLPGLTLADVIPDVHLPDLEEMVHLGRESPLLPAVDAHPPWKTRSSRSLNVIMEGVGGGYGYGCYAETRFSLATV